MLRPKHSDIALAIGVIGAITAAALVYFGDASALNDTWTGQWGAVVLAGPSAWLAGMACAGSFGHRGAWGVVGAAFGAILSTVLGAAIAGTAIIPLFGTLLAPIALVAEAFLNPAILGIWMVSMMGLHVLVLKSTQRGGLSG